MLYALDRLVVQQFSVSAVNTQITALNTALSVSATALAALMDGLTEAPKDSDDRTLLVRYVGEEGARGELAFSGKRDTLIAVRLLYVSRHTTLATAKLDIQVALEAMQTVLETLPGLEHGSTNRQCVNVTDIAAQFVRYKVSEEVIRHGGELRFTAWMRTEGV